MKLAEDLQADLQKKIDATLILTKIESDEEEEKVDYD